MRRLQLQSLGFILFALFGCDGWAQGTQVPPPASPEPPFALNFSGSAAEGGEAVMPVLFTHRSGAPNVFDVRIRLSYPSAVLRFRTLEESELARRAGLQVRSREENPFSGQSALELSFAFSDRAQGNFPTGQLGTAAFELRGPPPGDSVTLKAELWIDGRSANQSLASVEDARIEISPAVFMPCFFFSH